MKHVSEVAQGMGLTRHGAEAAYWQARRAAKRLEPSEEARAHAAREVNRLFKELKSICPAWRYSFEDKHAVAYAKKTWTKAFLENGITHLEQVQMGLRVARASTSPHVPSVGQFIAWCRPSPEDLGLLPEREAYREACRLAHCSNCDDWSHSAVYIAAREAGFWELRNLPETKSLPLFERTYRLICNRLVAGEDLDVELPKRLPTGATKCPTEPHAALERIQMIREDLGLRKSS